MALSKVKFVSTTYIKENTVIEQNFDDSKLVPFIYSTQRTVLEQSLGTTFYKHLENGVVNNTLTIDEENLIREYIQPMLANYVFYEVFPFIQYKSTNRGISKESSEYSQPSDLDEVKYVRNSIFNLAQFYLKRLNKFLLDYPNLFPTYQNPGSKVNLRKNSKSYFSGIFTPKTNRLIMRVPIFDDPTEPGGYYDCQDC